MSEIEFQRTESEEAHTVRTFYELLVDKIFCLFLLSLEYEAAHLVEVID